MIVAISPFWFQVLNHRSRFRLPPALGLQIALTIVGMVPNKQDNNQ
jgi:hypothetical protein